jgi:succinate dehydrogenase/fumarate reductase flavoprotein subunit
VSAQRHLSGNTYPRSLYIAEGTGRALLDYLAPHAEAIGVQNPGGMQDRRSAAGRSRHCGALLWDRHAGGSPRSRPGRWCSRWAEIGRIYDDSTYPVDVGSSAYGLALKGGARLMDMEFVQFEPW